jgi:hypothetical protein
MIPLKTFVGAYKKKDLNKIFNKKKVIIWGTGPTARETFCTLQGHKIKIKYFIDNRIQNDGHFFLKKKILNFKKLEKINTKKFFIIIATNEYKKKAHDFLLNELKLKKKNFCNWLKIARPFAVVNLLNNGKLSYKKIYDKIITTIPFISKIEIWFEKNYKYKDLNYRSFVYSEKNLLNSFNLKISQLKFIKKLKKLKNSQIYLHCGDEIESQVELMVNYNNILKELNNKNSFFNDNNLKNNLNFFIYQTKNFNYEKLIKILEKKKIKYWLCDPYIMPYDKILDCLENFGNIKKLKKIYKYFNFDINSYLKLSSKSKNKPCLSQRAYPVIDNNNILKHCSLYEKPLLSDNATEVNLINKIKERSNNKFCERCQNFSLHRFDLKVLDNEYNKQNLFRNKNDKIL